MGPLLILAATLLTLGYALLYVGASIGTSWQTDLRKALLSGLTFAGAQT
jgi:hypothetical protein